MTTPIGFLDIDRAVVPRSVLDATMAHLRAAGATGREGFVIWAGVRSETTMHMLECIVPTQAAYRGEKGVCVVIDGDALFHLNVYLHEKGMLLFAQVHSHPTDAYHSETDDMYAVVTTLGGLSLVVPNFARAAPTPADWAAYRLTGPARWTPLTLEQHRALIVYEA